MYIYIYIYFNALVLKYLSYTDSVYFYYTELVVR